VLICLSSVMILFWPSRSREKSSGSNLSIDMLHLTFPDIVLQNFELEVEITSPSKERKPSKKALHIPQPFSAAASQGWNPGGSSTGKGVCPSSIRLRGSSNLLIRREQ
jgi:hypothetical protein